MATGNQSEIRYRLNKLRNEVAAADWGADFASDLSPGPREYQASIHFPGLVEATQAIEELDLELPPFANSSKSPMGRLWHRLIGRSVRRDTNLLAERLSDLRSELLFALDILHREFAHEYGMREATTSRRLGAVEGWIQDRQFNPTFSSLAFSDRFRGQRDDIMQRYVTVAERLAQHSGTVLDLGCGRGELIDLITQRGGEARGVELDPQLVAFCQSRQLDVIKADAFDALAAEADGSLGAVAMIQVVEHVTAQQLVRLIPLIYRKLAPEGLLAIETVNGTSPFVYTRSFYTDPTHTNPVHHGYLEFLVASSGFTGIEIEFRSPVAEIDKMKYLEPSPPESPDPHLVSTINERIRFLNEFLFGHQDYFLWATRGVGPDAVNQSGTGDSGTA